MDNGGIRFVLFMQGCAMRCRFCHNPDTWLKKGRTVTVDEIMRQLRSYRVFFELSGGGLTVSGGEPLLQQRFVRELFLDAGSEGIHRALDTSGFCQHGCFEAILDVADLLLFSIKAIDPELHRDLTCVDNYEILANLHQAATAPLQLRLRYVLIPGVNDSDRDISALVDLAHSLPGKVEVEVLPYHRLGKHKWQQLGMEYPMEDIKEPTVLEVQRVVQILDHEKLAVYATRESGSPLGY